jgi:hypothetical protein
MVTDIDDAPTHRLRLHPRTRALSRHAVPRADAATSRAWLYAGLAAGLAIAASTQLFALGHVR